MVLLEYKPVVLAITSSNFDKKSKVMCLFGNFGHEHLHQRNINQGFSIAVSQVENFQLRPV